MSEQAVTDSTCLIALERIGQLDLLRQVFAPLFAPPAVQAELGVSVDVKLVEEKTLERFEGKGERVIDKREL